MFSTCTPHASLTASLCARNPCALLDIVGQNEGPVGPVMAVVDGFAIQLCQQNQRKRPVDVVRRVREDIAQSNQQAILVQSYRVIEACEGKEFDFDFRKRRSWAEFAMRCCED